MNFSATRQRVHNRGNPSESFLTELVAWARTAPDEIFAPNAVPVEIFTVIRSRLATPAGHDASGAPIFHWDNFLHRKAALLEEMRVHAGLESSWDWNEGVDVTNRASQRNRTGQETGIFQVSYDSEWISHGAMKPFAEARGIATVDAFIPAMKRDHALALEYYARLARISIAWAGPLLRHGDDSIYPWLRRDAAAEFRGLLLTA